MDELLISALDYGITELDYWEMTVGEVQRAIESKIRVERVKAQEKAGYDYILADLIGRSIARNYSSSAKMPTLSEAYPTLFDAQEEQAKREARQAEISAMRFRAFASAYNRNYRGGGEG